MLKILTLIKGFVMTNVFSFESISMNNITQHLETIGRSLISFNQFKSWIEMIGVSCTYFALVLAVSPIVSGFLAIVTTLAYTLGVIALALSLIMPHTSIFEEKKSQDMASKLLQFAVLSLLSGLILNVLSSFFLVAAVLITYRAKDLIMKAIPDTFYEQVGQCKANFFKPVSIDLIEDEINFDLKKKGFFHRIFALS